MNENDDNEKNIKFYHMQGALCMICMVNPPIKPVDVFE
jgi:hypothetical protein